jgi:hypothetical protein
MSSADFIPNRPPKRRPTVTLVPLAPLIGQDIAEVTRYPSRQSIPSLGLQQHQVLARFQLFWEHFLFPPESTGFAGICHSCLKFG